MQGSNKFCCDGNITKSSEKSHNDFYQRQSQHFQEKEIFDEEQLTRVPKKIFCVFCGNLIAQNSM